MPILLMVLGWGYQPERLFARTRLLFYTLLASLPLLLAVLLWSSVEMTSYSCLEYHCLNGQSSSANFVLALIACGGFLVKLPIFRTHLWLPRAHVEAPVEGSMLLASIILKLGGYGVYLVSPTVPTTRTMVSLVQSLALIGGRIVSVLCVRLTDMKVLIAYSSIAHMAMALATSLSFSDLGL